MMQLCDKVVITNANDHEVARYSHPEGLTIEHAFGEDRLYSGIGVLMGAWDVNEYRVSPVVK